MTGTELDEILAETPQVEQQAETTEANRDEQGRFASKVEAAPEVVTEKPAVEAEQHEGNIPPATLAASRQKAREKDQENEQLRQQMAELRGQIQLLSQQPRQQAPQVAAEPAKAPDFWEDPNAFVLNAMSPVQQELQQYREHVSRLTANATYGADVVKAAEAAVEAELSKLSADRQAQMRAARSKAIDPYAEMVTWFKQKQTMDTVGSDPNAWLEAEIEKRIADPEYQGKLLERIRATAAGNTNRSTPVTNLPPSLNRIAAGGNAPGEADVSDAGLFAHAMR